MVARTSRSHRHHPYSASLHSTSYADRSAGVVIIAMAGATLVGGLYVLLTPFIGH